MFYPECSLEAGNKQVGYHKYIFMYDFPKEILRWLNKLKNPDWGSFSRSSWQWLLPTKKNGLSKNGFPFVVDIGGLQEQSEDREEQAMRGDVVSRREVSSSIKRSGKKGAVGEAVPRRKEG